MTSCCSCCCPCAPGGPRSRGDFVHVPAKVRLHDAADAAQSIGTESLHAAPLEQRGAARKAPREDMQLGPQAPKRRRHHPEDEHWCAGPRLGTTGAHGAWSRRFPEDLDGRRDCRPEAAEATNRRRCDVGRLRRGAVGVPHDRVPNLARHLDPRRVPEPEEVAHEANRGVDDDGNAKRGRHHHDVVGVQAPSGAMVLLAEAGPTPVRPLMPIGLPASITAAAEARPRAHGRALDILAPVEGSVQ